MHACKQGCKHRAGPHRGPARPVLAVTRGTLPGMAEEEHPYRQVAAVLRREIETGALPLGARVPSVRTLAEREGVAKVTANRALAMLADEGLIEARRGVGSVVVARGSVEEKAAVREVTLAIGLGDVAAELIDAHVIAAASEDLASDLGCTPGEPVLVVRLLRQT